jgi:hypothetical protein
VAVPASLRSTKLLIAAAVALVVVVAAVIVAHSRSDRSRQEVAQYVAPDTAGRAPGQAQVLTEALRKRGLVCSDLYPDYRPLVVRGCYRKDATHDIQADFAATPDGRLSSANFQIMNTGPADPEPDLKGLLDDFAAAGAADGVASLVGKAGEHSTAWGTVRVAAGGYGYAEVELQRKGWTWPELPNHPFTGSADQVARTIAADGFTCTSGGTGVQNCERGADLVTAVSNGNTIRTLGIGSDSWTTARALQERLFTELFPDRAALVTAWFAAGRPVGARAYTAGLQLCQTTQGESASFKITAFDPAEHQSANC